jgi:hypothetical protein
LVHAAFFLDSKTLAVALFIRFNKGFVPVYLALTAMGARQRGDVEYFQPQTTYAALLATRMHPDSQASVRLQIALGLR